MIDCFKHISDINNKREKKEARGEYGSAWQRIKHHYETAQTQTGPHCRSCVHFTSRQQHQRQPGPS